MTIAYQNVKLRNYTLEQLGSALHGVLIAYRDCVACGDDVEAELYLARMHAIEAEFKARIPESERSQVVTNSKAVIDIRNARAGKAKKR